MVKRREGYHKAPKPKEKSDFRGRNVDRGVLPSPSVAGTRDVEFVRESDNYILSHTYGGRLHIPDYRSE